MQTNTKTELDEISSAPKCQVLDWNPTKGFGFVRVKGERAFVHISDVSPWHARGADLNGKILVVYSTEPDSKGPRVKEAATLEWHEKRLAELREKFKREEEARALEARVRAELPEFAARRLEDLFDMIEGDAARLSFHEASLSEGLFQLRSNPTAKSVQAISFGADHLRVRISFTAVVLAEHVSPHISIGEVGRRRFSYVAEGLHHASRLRNGNPLKARIMAFYEADEERKKEEKYQHQLAGVRKGLEFAGIADLVNPEEVLKSWPTAGDSFACINQEYDEKEPMLVAKRWFRDKRRAEIERILDEQAGALGVETVRRWVTEMRWDPNYDDELYGGDGMKGLGGYVGGGERSERHKWSSQIIQRVFEADNAAGNRLDLAPAIEAELLAYLKAEDDAEIAKGGFAREANLKLPESRIRFARKRIGEWASSWMSNGGKDVWQRWITPPQVADEAVAKKADQLFIALKARALRKEGVEKEAARLAAENPAEEYRVRSIARVHRDWKELSRQSPRRVSRDLHPDAMALLEEMRAHRNVADHQHSQEIGQADGADEACQAAQEIEEARDRFLTGDAWRALDGLSLKK